MSETGVTEPAVPARKPRIGVIGPAGNLVGRDEVETYWARDPAKSATSFSNIGDLFVYDSSLKILEHAEVVPISLSPNRPLEERVEAYQDLDYVFLRGSNYINPNVEWHEAVRLLERLPVPVRAFGIGLQTPEDSTRYFNESSERFFKLIAERSGSLAIRGELSAAALATIGIKDVRIIGCPTVFRHRRRRLEVARRGASEIRRLGFTLRRKTYGSATLQRHAMRALAERYDLRILCAGELEEKILLLARDGALPDAAAARARAVAGLVEDRWIWGEGDGLLGLYDRALEHHESVSGFEAAVRGLDAVTGFRLHGNLLSLANGVPALYVVYDTRTREFVKTLGIPSVESRTMDKWSFEASWEEARWDRFEAAYAKRFGELEAFLVENAMPHRLEAAPSREAQAPRAA